MILVVDFGSQTAHLIARRLRDLGVMATIVTPDAAYEKALEEKPKGLVFSGGPLSVYETGAPTIDEHIYTLGVPILGICYGYMITAHLLGGRVVSHKKEYGPSEFTIHQPVVGSKFKIIQGVPERSTVWMNHGDEIVALPKGFTVIGSTSGVPYTAAVDEKRKLYMLLFHPEMDHTQYGPQILRNFIEICTITPGKHIIDADALIAAIKQTVGEKHVIGAVSGGVDSTVAGTLVAEAIGKRFIPIFVDNGLMRDDARVSVKKAFEKFGIQPIIVDAQEEMLKRLRGVTDGEEKRKIIGKFYIDVFEQEMEKLIKKDHDVQFLLQGTIYSDVIESQGTKHASKIKSHHNVGGLPETMKLKLLEPLRELYKDEVRELGKRIGLSDDAVFKQPFPGPGYAVRIRGEVTKERLAKEKQADKIVLEELGKTEWLQKVFLSFPVMTDAYSTAIKGDGRFFGEVIALRIIESKDVMTSHWSDIPYDLLQRIATRIVNEVPEISRVVYDITTKPPATMEWE